MQINSPKELAAYVMQQRKKNKLSQSKIADAVGLKQATISAFENKPAGTKLETLFQILSSLDLALHVIPKNKTMVGQSGWKEEW